MPPNTLFGTEGRQSGRMIREVWDSFVFLVDQTGLELARPPCKGHRRREAEEAFQEKNDGSEQDSSFL